MRHFLVTEPILLDLREPTILTVDDLDLLGGRLGMAHRPPAEPISREVAAGAHERPANGSMDLGWETDGC